MNSKVRLISLIVFLLTVLVTGYIQIAAASNLTIKDSTTIAHINVKLTKSNVNSFMETYQTSLISEDVGCLGNLYNDDPYFYEDGYGVLDISKADLILAFQEIFSQGDIEKIHWEILSFEDNTAKVNVAIYAVGESPITADPWEEKMYFELKIKNINNNLYIFEQSFWTPACSCYCIFNN